MSSSTAAAKESGKVNVNGSAFEHDIDDTDPVISLVAEEGDFSGRPDPALPLVIPVPVVLPYSGAVGSPMIEFASEFTPLDC
jgi:hypothetical protein